ncbi:hypothetical protein SAY86_001123 [Trapa natans]|uniref:Pectinesterase inhibitor domain-containing protein n=1 Tax=Trapa natans TaxID=22666 RepID=A0AAN7MBH8_TRANT|nr:hypothetical protein SAY86_001123 [Trapa natans]
MEQQHHKINSQLLLLLVFSALAFSGPTHAICVPRNSAGGFDTSLGKTNMSVSLSSLKPVSAQSTPALTPTALTPPPTVRTKLPVPVVSSLTPPIPTLATTLSANGGGARALPAAAAPKLKAVCTNLTDFPDLCVSTLTPFLSGEIMVDDKRALLDASIKAVINGTNALIALAEEYAGRATSPQMKESLEGCKNDFANVLEDIKSATDAMAIPEYYTISMYLSTSITNISDCDDEFWGLNPMKSDNQRLKDMFDNCLALAQSINWRTPA